MKNKLMRAATLLLVLTLMTSCFVGSTFAKYTTESTGTDTARVAVWGIDAPAVEFNLFDDTYSTDVDSNDGDNVIAPGTNKTSNIQVINAINDAIPPEVDYRITVDVSNCDIDPLIKANQNIQWKLDSGAWGSWDALMASIKALSGEADGSCDYDAGDALPDAFKDGATHSISWQWLIEGAYTYDTDSDPLTPELTQDEYDTLILGNAAVAGDLNATIEVTITATQINN